MAILLLGLALPPQQGECLYESQATWCDNGETRDGYWWNGGWAPGLITEEAWLTETPGHAAGRAVWYAPWVMEATAQARGMSLEGFVDGVAMMSPSDIGKTVWIWVPELGWDGPFLVVDCAQWDDMWPIVRYRREVVEVGWRTKERWGMEHPLDVLVWTEGTWYETPTVDYPDWWLSLVGWN